MQRFVEADYYALDWYYEECADGKQHCSRDKAICLFREGDQMREREREGWTGHWTRSRREMDG